MTTDSSGVQSDAGVDVSRAKCLCTWLGQVACIVVVSILVSAVAALVHAGQGSEPVWSSSRGVLHSDRATDPLRVTPADAKAWGSDVLWVDARDSPSANGWAGSGKWVHDSGAVVRLTEEAWGTQIPELLVRWTPGQPVIVFCNVGECQRSRVIARRLRAEVGIESAYWLDGEAGP